MQSEIERFGVGACDTLISKNLSSLCRFGPVFSCKSIILCLIYSVIIFRVSSNISTLPKSRFCRHMYRKLGRSPAQFVYLHYRPKNESAQSHPPSSNFGGYFHVKSFDLFHPDLSHKTNAGTGHFSAAGFVILNLKLSSLNFDLSMVPWTLA